MKLLATSLLLLLSVGGCNERVRPPVASGSMQDVASQESWNSTITFTDSGRVTGILRAGHIAIFSEKKFTALDSGLTVDFFDDRERHTSVLTARRGQVNDVTHDFEAHGNVVVVSDSGTTLMTEDLYWTNYTHKIHSQAFVEITSPTEQIQGHGFESNQDLKHYIVFKVTGQSKPNE
jgi:LPS export ABC transporter protein LptC